MEERKTSPDAPVDAVVLRPCPFCGGSDQKQHAGALFGTAKLAAVTCPCGVSTPRFGHISEAVEWWNARSIGVVPAANGDDISGGWRVSAKFLFAISEAAESAGNYASAESVEAVILELADRGMLRIGQ